MKKIIICDFNRTIYDPDKEEIFPGVFDTLGKLRAAGYTLVLLSQVREKSREDLVCSLFLEKHFDRVVLVPLKTVESFAQLLTPDVDVKNSFSIGDYIETDIAYAKRLGMQTIRIASGAFEDVEPKTPEELADFSVTAFRKVTAIILDHQKDTIT